MSKIPQKPVNQHKRLAMGDTVKGYAKGGSIGTMRQHMPTSPVTDAKRANGVKGMSSGGGVGGKKSCK